VQAARSMAVLQHRRGVTAAWASQRIGGSLSPTEDVSKQKSATPFLHRPFFKRFSLLAFCCLVGLMCWNPSGWQQHNVPPEMIVETIVRKSLGNLHRPPNSIALRGVDLKHVHNQNSSVPIPLRWMCIQAIRERQRREISLDSILFNHLVHSNEHQLEILLVDPAYHPNVGDHMISEGEHVFFKREILRALAQLKENTRRKIMGTPRITYRECGYFQASVYAPPCQDLLKGKSQTESIKIAFWHGGGNWGDLWKKIQKFRSESLQPLIERGYRVYGFPQSLYFAEREVEMENAQYLSRLSSALQKNNATHSSGGDNQLVLMWREHRSFERAKKLYPFAKHKLVPDIAFQLGPYRASMSQPPAQSSGAKEDFTASTPQVDILLLLRNDHESIFAEQRFRGTVTAILSKLSSNKERISFSIVDWPDRLDRFSDEESGPDKNFLFTQKAISLLNLGRVVVCDRLHAAILAYLSGMSFVYLDQVSGKIDKTMTVALESHPTSCYHDQWNQSATKVNRMTGHNIPARWWSRGSNLTHGLELAMQMLHQQGREGSDRRRRHG